MKSARRLSALIYKEVIQVLRDPRTLIFTVLLPLIELFLFAYAVTLTVDHLPTVLVDQSRDQPSRDFVQALVNSSYFDVTATALSAEAATAAIDAGQAKAAVIIPPNFSSEVTRGSAQALILLDGSDSFSVQSGYNAASAVAQRFSIKLIAQQVSGTGALPVALSARILYNPDMDDLTFMLPGLIALLVQNIIIALAAVAVVRERELGTMEQLLATPVRPLELIIAKLVPGLIVVLVDAAVILALGVFWFGVPFRGNLALFTGAMTIFILAGMGLGLLISTVTRSQKQAQQISVLLMVFTMLLTGFIYPRTSMPDWCRVVGDLMPLTYFVRVARAIVSKGVGWASVWSDTAILVAYAIATIGLAALVFKRRLD